MNNKRLNWKSYRCASIDLQTHEPFRNKQFFVSLKEILRQRRGYSKIKLKFESVLRRHDKLWRNSSALARKQHEQVSVLEKHRGKKKYRPVLIRQAREDRWHDIACSGRSFNDGISWGAAGIKYTSPGGDEECIFYVDFNLGKAKGDACIVLKRNHFCCASCSAEIMNRSEITNEAEYDYIIPLFKL